MGPTRAASTSPSPFELAAIRVQGRDALVGLGWKPSIARAAIDEAVACAGGLFTLEAQIREGLRCCPRPGR